MYRNVAKRVQSSHKATLSFPVVNILHLYGTFITVTNMDTLLLSKSIVYLDFFSFYLMSFFCSSILPRIPHYI